MFIVSGNIQTVNKEEKSWGDIVTVVLIENKLNSNGETYQVHYAVELPPQLRDAVERADTEYQRGVYCVATGNIRSRQSKTGYWFTSMKAATLKVIKATPPGVAVDPLEDLPF